MKTQFRALAISTVVGITALVAGVTISGNDSSLAGWGYGSFGAGAMTGGPGVSYLGDTQYYRNMAYDTNVRELSAARAIKFTSEGIATYNWRGTTLGEGFTSRVVVCARATKATSFILTIDGVAAMGTTVSASTALQTLTVNLPKQINPAVNHKVQVQGKTGLIVDAIGLAASGVSNNNECITI